MTKSRIMTAALIVVLVLLAAAAWLMFGRTAAGMSYPDADKYTVGSSATVSGPVDSLYVDWTSGQVNIEYHDGKDVMISETTNRPLSEDDTMRWWLDGGTLRIRYARPGFRISVNLEKELTVSLPAGIVLKSADLGTTSGDLNIPSLAADEIRLDSTSGSIDAGIAAQKLTASSTSGSVRILQDGDIDTVTLNSTSGSIACAVDGSVKSVLADSTSGSIGLTVSGTAGDVKLTSTSGSIYPNLSDTEKAEFGSTSGSVDGSVTAFRELKISTTSGNVSVNLPAEPGFTCKVSTSGGSFSSSLALTKDGNAYTCGDGSASCSIGTTSGDIRIGKAE